MTPKTHADALPPIWRLLEAPEPLGYAARNALMASKTLAYAFIGNLGICVMNDRTPTEDEHFALLKAFKQQDLDKLRTLTLTSGGAPSAAQRKRLVDALEGRRHTSALVTDSQVALAIATALSWFIQGLKAFSPARLDDALRYLEVPATEWDRVRTTIVKLQMEVNAHTVKSSAEH